MDESIKVHNSSISFLALMAVGFLHVPDSTMEITCSVIAIATRHTITSGK